MKDIKTIVEQFQKSMTLLEEDGQPSTPDSRKLLRMSLQNKDLPIEEKIKNSRRLGDFHASVGNSKAADYYYKYMRSLIKNLRYRNTEDEGIRSSDLTPEQQKKLTKDLKNKELSPHQKIQAAKKLGDFHKKSRNSEAADYYYNYMKKLAVKMADSNDPRYKDTKRWGERAFKRMMNIDQE